MPELTTETFIAGSYVAPYFTNDFPGPFAPPAPAELLTVLAGNPITLHVAVPAGGGNLSLELYKRGDVGEDRTNLITSEAPVVLSGQGAPNVGDDVAFTLSGELIATLSPDTYTFAFIQSAVVGQDTVETVVEVGSFDVLSVGF